jgi:N-acetylglutamate synthase-like GNAT family acetyltransferase
MVAQADAAPRVSIRAAVPADIDVLVQLINDAYAQSERNVFPSTTRTQRSGIERHLDEVYVAESVGGPLGSVHVHIDGDRAHFGMLAVSVDHHHVGIGSLLIRHAEQIARAAGCKTMHIEVVKEGIPDRVAYYARRGYVVTRETDGQTWNGGADWGAAISWHMVDMEKPL